MTTEDVSQHKSRQDGRQKSQDERQDFSDSDFILVVPECDRKKEKDKDRRGRGQLRRQSHKARTRQDKQTQGKTRVHDGQDERPQDRKRKATLGERGREEH